MLRPSTASPNSAGLTPAGLTPAGLAPALNSAAHFLSIGSRDRVEVLEGDLECLKPGEFLNDKIIDFYLKQEPAGHDPQRRTRCSMCTRNS